jgi:hypothetical protein
MKKRNLMMLALMGITAGLTVESEAAGEVAECSKCQKTAGTTNSCARLTNAEQDFSSKLNDKNKKMFCEKFTMEQRKSAMMAACNTVYNCGANRNAGKNILKPDDAVMKVAKDNKLSSSEEMSEKRESISSNAGEADKKSAAVEANTAQ